jgi:hypothetical protein
VFKIIWEGLVHFQNPEKRCLRTQELEVHHPGFGKPLHKIIFILMKHSAKNFPHLQVLKEGKHNQLIIAELK